VRKSAGAVQEWFGTATDIDDQKRIEERLRTSEECLLFTAKATQVTLFQQDAQLRYTWITNPIRGYSVEGIIGRTDEEISHTIENVDALIAAKRAALSTGVGSRIEVLNRIGSEVEYHELTIEPMRGQNGAIVGLLGASINTTARHRAEADTRRLATIIEATPDFVAVGRLNGEVVYLSRAGRRMLGIPVDADPATYRHAQLCPA
jgi:PAS domain-containing protein